MFVKLLISGCLAILVECSVDCDGIGGTRRTVRQGRKCVIFETTKNHNFTEAKQTCLNEGWRLLIADTQKEREEICTPLMRTVDTIFDNDHWWISAVGFEQHVNGAEPGGGWFWLDGPESTMGTPLPANDSGWLNYLALNPDDHPVGPPYREDTGSLAMHNGSTNYTAMLNSWWYHYPTTYFCEAVEILDPLRLSCAQLGGQQVGSSCFFVEPTAQTWDQCWTSLAGKGARPARLYTKNILDIINVLLDIGGSYWTALKYTSANTIHWMLNPTTADAAGGGWHVRPASDPALATGGSQCAELRRDQSSVRYFEESCTEMRQCLGEIVGPFQKYEKLTEDHRMQPVNGAYFLSNTTVTRGHLECAFECQTREGCLGFNFNQITGYCELLTFKSDGIPTHGSYVSAPQISYYERRH